MFYQPIRDKYISPFTDFGFKKLFGEECNKDLLLDFLNELLYEEEGRIVSISYLKLERLGVSSNFRKAIFDIYCENEKGEKFIVELQKETQDFFIDRSVYYSTFPIMEQATKGEGWQYELKAVYMIAILGFVFEENKNDPNKYRYDVKLCDIETKKVFYNKLTFIYLEMPKFVKPIQELANRFEKWMYVIHNLSQLDYLPNELRETIFERMFAAAEVARLSQAEYMLYVENLKIHRDNSNCFKTAIRKALEEGKAEGKAKGKAEGLAEGLAEGFEKGRIEGEKERLKLQQELEALKQLLGK